MRTLALRRRFVKEQGFTQNVSRKFCATDLVKPIKIATAVHLKIENTVSYSYRSEREGIPYFHIP